MISNKMSTQNFSKAQQVHDFKDEKRNFTAATKTEGGKGEERAVGDILNEVANPGGKNPNKPVRKASNTLDKDDFLKLMLTQMKNQDPMNPMQSHEMAAQLAQFTSLEQLFNVNKNLEGLTKSQDPMQKYHALNFLGKTIKADSRQILRAAGDTASDMRFDLSGDASKLKVTITNESGEMVKSIEFGGLKKGVNRIAWNGTDSNDREVKPGRYFFSVEAENTSGQKVGVKTETKGTITGINYSPEGPMLMVGDQKVRLQDVQKIEDETLKETQNRLEGQSTGTPAPAPSAEVVKQMAQQVLEPPVSKPVVKMKPEDKGTTSAPQSLMTAQMVGPGLLKGGSVGN